LQEETDGQPDSVSYGARDHSRYISDRSGDRLLVLENQRSFGHFEVD